MRKSGDTNFIFDFGGTGDVWLRCRSKMKIMSPTSFAIRGQTFCFKADPFAGPAEEAYSYDSDGAVIVSEGYIVETGTASAVLPRHPNIRVDHYPAPSPRPAVLNPEAGT